MNENTERPNFYAIIPASVRYSEVTANAKLLYGEITALANKTGTCWASNKYFSELYGVQPTRISEWVKQLEAAGFIRTKVISGGARGIEIPTLLEIQKTPSGKAEGTLLENQKHNNTTNTTSKNDVSLVDQKKLLGDIVAIVNPREKVTDERLRLLRGRLKDYTADEITASARAFSKSQWHKENKQMSIDNLLAPSKFGRWYAVRVAEAPQVDENKESHDAAREFRLKHGGEY